MSIRSWNSTLIIRLILIVFAAVNIYPVLFTVFTSLKTTEEFYSNLWSFPSQIHLENYIQAFKVGRLGDYFFNSIVIVVVTLLAATVLATFAAYALARLQVPFTGAIVGILFILMILPAESMIIPLYMMMSKLKMFQVVYIPIVVVYVGWLLPGTIVILRNFFLSIPGELLESARIDGCSEFGTMFRIVFPLSGAAIATCTVFNFGFAWGELMWAQIATLTTDKGVPISVGLINFQGQYTTNWPLMTAGMCMVLLPLIVLFIFLQKYFVQGLTSGAVKG
ncbi:carbohydrate ABC transporter permease [Paenibacillus sp. GCM10027628]|uniref:carbohydrate ABC transporter permease n=1 Tax=Paenibacillus sp. GCM10027628 TaxID=3273413 RepID=UPI0036304FD5